MRNVRHVFGFCAFVFLLVAFATSSALSAVTLWTGLDLVDPSLWSDPDNWGTGVPTSTSTAEFGAGPTQLAITLPTGAVADSLTFNANGYELTGGDLSVSNAIYVDALMSAKISSVIVGTQFNKTGAGTLHLTGNNTYAGGTTISAGTLKADVSGTVNALGTGAVTLAGGTLDLNPIATQNLGISGRTFSTGVVLGDTSRFDYTGTAASTRIDGNLNIASGTSIPANTATQWIGKIKITTAGSYTFGTASDDGSRLYIDGVLVVNNDGGKGVLDSTSAAITLSAGLHDIRVDHVNGSGSTGEILRYGGPDQTTYGVIPTTVLFQAETNTLAGASNAVVLGNNVNVTASSTINLNGSEFTQVQIGNLAQTTGTTLTVSGLAGKTLRVGGMATLGNAAGAVTIDNVPDVAFDGVVTDSGNAMTIAKTNTGRLVFGQTANPNPLLSTTTLDIQGGQLVLVGSTAAGANNPIGSAKIQLSGTGAALVLDSKGATTSGIGPTFNNAVNVTQNATIQSVANAAVTTLGGGTNGISIADSMTLTLDAIAGGQLSGPAGGDPGAILNIAGPITGSASTTLNLTSTVLGSFTGASRGTVLLSGDNSGFLGTLTFGSSLTLVMTNPNAITSAFTLPAGSGLSYLFDGDGTGAPASVNFADDITISGTGTATIAAGRLGTTYAPLFAQAQNKTAQLGTLSIGAQTLAITNNNGYGVTFAGATTLTGAPTFSVANATASNVVQGLTLDGVVSGAYGMTKAGAGTLVLANAGNTFAGDIAITQGVVSIADDNNTGTSALGAAANKVLLNPSTGTSTLRATGTFTLAHTIQLTNTVNNRAIEVTPGNTLTINTAFDLNGLVPNAAKLSKNDSGTLVLSAANSTNWTGGLTINGGAVRIEHGSALGATTAPVSISPSVAASGAALQLAGGITFPNPIALQGNNNVGTGGINFGGQLQSVAGVNTVTGQLSLSFDASLGADAGATLNVNGGVHNPTTTTRTFTFNAGAGGTININSNFTAATTTANQYYGLQKFGPGTVNFTTANSTVFTNVFNVYGGTLALSGAGTLAGGTGVALTVNAGSTVQIDNSGSSVASRLGSRPLSLIDGTFQVIGNGTAVSTQTLGALTSAHGGNTIQVNTTAQNSTITFASMNANGINGGSTLVFRSAGTGANFGTAQNKVIFTTAPTLTPGTTGILARGVVIDGAGVNFATYGAANGIAAYSAYNNGGAYTNINLAGATDTVKVGTGFVTTGILTGNRIINALNITDTASQTVNASAPGTLLTLTSGGILVAGGSHTLGSNLVVSAGATEFGVNVAAGATLNVDGVFAHVGGTNNFTKGLEGNLVFNAKQYFNTGTNSFTLNGGTTTLAGGVNTLFPGQNVAVGPTSTFDLNGNSQFIGGLRSPNSTGVISGGFVTSSAPATLLSVDSTNDNNFGGQITGGVSLVKGGNKTLTLYGDSTYTGSTLVQGGTLTVIDSGRLSATSAITIDLGTLYIRNDGRSSMNDRVNDAAPITLRTGQVQFKNRQQTDSAETLGALILAQGNNEINVGSTAGTGTNSSELRFASISQSTSPYNGGTGLDAITNLQNDSGQLGSNTRLFFTTPPALVNNILPVWIEHGGNEFVTYSPTLGVMPLSAVGAPGYTGTTLPTVDNATSATGNYRITASGVVPTGGLTVNTLNINGAYNVTFGTATDVLNIAAGGLIKSGTTGTLIGGSVDEGQLTAGGASPSGTVRLHVMDAVNGNSLTINSRIINNGASPLRLIVDNYNGGTVVVTNGANSYTGGTVVNGWNGNGAGGLRLDGWSGQVVIPAGGLTINNSTVTMVNNPGQIHSSNVVYLNGNAVLTLLGDNTLDSLSFDNTGGTTNPTVTTGGVLTLSAATPITVTSSNSGSVPTVAGTLDFGGAAKSLSVGAITVNGLALAPNNAAANISAIIQNSGAISKTGSGNLQLSGQSTFTGGVNVSDGGLIIGTNSTPITGAVASGPVGTGTLSVAAGKTLLASGAFTVANALTAAGNLNFAGANNLTFTGAISLPTSLTINVDQPNMTAGLLGTITGAAGGITKTGLGSLAINPAYAGTVTLPSGGALSLLTDGDGTGRPESIAFSTVISTTSSLALTVGRTGITYSPYYPSAANKTVQLASVPAVSLAILNNNGHGLEITGPIALTVTQSYTVANATGSNVVQGLTLSGQVTGAGVGIVKQGAGTLVLGNSTNSFGGAGSSIDIQGGVVAVASDGALGNTSNSINLNIAGTTGVGLRATGTFATGRTINFAQATNAIEVTGGNTLTLNSAFTGTSATTQLVKNDNGVLELNAANPTTWKGSITAAGGSAQVLTGGVLVNAGVVRISNAAALGASTNIIAVNTTQGSAVEIAGGISVPNPIVLNTQTSNGYAGGINWSGGLHSVGSGVTNTWAGAISENQDSGITADANNTLNITGGINQNAHITVYGGAGTINVTGGAITAVHSLDKIGSGTLNIQVATAAPTGNGIRVYAGNLTFSGAGAVSGAGTIATIINPGGTLNLDSSGTATSSRLGGRVMTLAGGNLNLIGNSGTAVTEAIGAPTFNRGQSTITVTDGGAGTNLTFTAASNNVSPAQSTGGSMSTVLFRGTSLGTAAGPGVATIQSTTGGINFNGQTGAAGTTTKGIMPWAIVDTSTTGLGFSFATADTTTSILRPLAANEYSNTAALVASTNALINTASGSITNQNTIAPNSLTFDNSTSITMNAGQTLSLSSGGILVRNGSASSISGGIGSQPAGNSGWSIHTVGTASLTISSLMNGGQSAANGGLVKAGGGTLTLSTPTAAIPGVSLLNGVSANTLNMQTVVNQGTLVLNGGVNALGTTRYLEVGPGGTLDLNGNTQVVRGLYTDGSYNGIPGTVTAGGTVTNTAGTQATLIANSDDRNWSGQITGNVFYNKSGIGNVTMYTPQTYTAPTLINAGTLTLRDSAMLLSTSAVAIDYASLTLSNTGSTDLTNRLGDTIPLTMRGGTLTFQGRVQTDSKETIGAVSVVQGYNTISNTNGGTGIASSELTIASVSRPAGSSATLRFTGGWGQIGSVSREYLTSYTLTNNIIGPWAIFDREWASVIPGMGVGAVNSNAGFMGYSNQTLTGTPLSTDNVRVAGTSQTMVGSQTINTLNFTFNGNQNIDLNGQTLTLAGGGLLITTSNDNVTGSVINGYLTSGYANGSVNDLYLYHLPYAGTNRQTVISAAITDNGSTPVRLIATSSEGAASANRITLNGANSYTGGTVINGGTLVPGTGGVIPAGGITINAGMLDHAPANQTTALGTINPANVVTLNGPSTVSLVGDNTLAGLVFDNIGGGSNPTVNSFKAGQGVDGKGTLTIGASGITASSSNVTTTATLVGRFDFGVDPNTIHVNPITVNGVSVAPLQAALAIQGIVGSAGGITKTGDGTLQLNAQSTFTGTLSVTAGGVSFGTLGNTGLAANNAAGSRYARIDLAGGTFLNLNNTDATIGSLSGSGAVFNQTSAPENGQGGATGRTFNLGFDGTSSTFSGSFSRWSDVLPASYQVNKIGAGTMTLTGVSTTTSNLQVSQGGVTFSGAGTGVFGTNLVLPTGTLTLDNSTTNVDHRLTGGLGTGGTLQILGGTVRIIGNAAAPTTETIGTLTFNGVGGPSTLTLEANAAQPLTFTALALGAQSANTALIRGISSTAGAGQANLALNAVALGGIGGGGANGTTNMSIRPEFLGDASPTGVGTGFITKDSLTNFLRPLASAELATTVLPGASHSTINFGLSSVAALYAGGQFGSLTLNSGGGLALHSAVASGTPEGMPVAPQIVSGGILALPGNAGINVGRIASNGSQTLLIHTLGDLSLTGVLYNTTSGLTKAEGGMLTLNSKALYTGQTNVNGGTLKLAGGDNTLPVLVTAGAPNAQALAINSPTAVLDLNGNNQLVGNLLSSARYAGNGGTITNTSGTAAALTANLAGAQVYGGTVAGNLNFNKTGNNALTLTSPSTFTGSTTIRANTLNLMDAGALNGTSAINLFYGGLNLDQSGLNPIGNANPTRFPAATPVNLCGGTLTLTPGGSADSTATIDTVNLLEGRNQIAVPQAPISGFGALTIGNLARSNPDATVNFTGGAGGYFSNNPGLNQSQLFINQIDGYGIPDTITNKILGGWALASNGEFVTIVNAGTTGSNGINWGVITMNGTTGPLGTIVQNQYDSNAATLPASNANSNVRLNGTAATVTVPTGGATYNVLAVRNATTAINFAATGDVLNLQAGGLALTNGGTVVGANAGTATADFGRLTAGGTATGTNRLYIYANGAANTVNSRIIDNAVGGSVRVIITPIANALTIAGLNTYTGGTVVNGAGGTVTFASASSAVPAGGLTLNNVAVTSSVAGNIVATNGVTLNGGSSLTLTGANTLNSVTFNNNGGTANPTITTGGILTLTAANAITVVNDNAATVPTIAGAVSFFDLTAPAIEVSTTAGVPTGLVISGTWTADAALNKNGAGSVLFSNGTTTSAVGFKLNAGTLILGVNSTPTSGALTSGPLGRGTLTIADGTAIISDGTLRTIANNIVLNGNVTFGSTTGVANASTVAGNGVVLNGNVNLGAATRAINVNSFLNTSTLGGVISGDSGVGLTKTGPGTLVLTNTANTFSGPVTIEGGALYAADYYSLGNGTGTNTVTFAGGILGHAAGTTADLSGRISSADNQKIYIDTNGNNVTYTSALTSATGGSFGKFGAGTLILTANANYDGNTLINGGTLQLGNGGFSGAIPTTSNILNGGIFAINRAASETITHDGTITGSGGITINQATFQPKNTVLLGGNLGFGTSPGTTTVGTLDLSSVSAVFGGILVQTNNATANTVNIPVGKTLSINGNVTMGYDAAGGTGATLSKLTVAGEGSMSVTGTTISIGTNQAATNAAYWNDSTLDLTGLGSGSSGFSANVTTFNIGVGTTTQGPGTVLLSNVANTILATTLTVGDTGANNGKGPGTLQLGTGTNIIQADTINVGRGKGSGNGFLKFASQTAGSPGTVVITNKAGTGAADITVGDNNGTNTAGGASGTLDLRGHVSTVTANTLLIGRNNMAAGNAGGVTGTVSFDAGNFTVNTVNMAPRLNGGTGAATATLNIGGGNFTVNTGGSFTLGSQVTAGTSVATLNLTGGAFTSNVDVLDGGGATTSTISLNGGTLDMTGKNIGSATTAIDTLTFAAGTLKNVGLINGAGGVTKTTAGTLIVDGTNAYTGATLVSGGTLKIVGISSINTSSGITVNGADARFITTSSTPVDRTFILTQGTFGGTGTITTAINSGANVIIAPGDRTLLTAAAGTLTVNNAVNLSGGTTDLRLFGVGATDRDKLVSTAGDFTFGGMLSVTKVDDTPWTFAAGQSWDLFDWNPTGTVSGSFANVFPAGLPVLPSELTWDTSALYTSGVISIAGVGPITGTWSGGVDNLWSTSVTGNWTGSVPSAKAHVAIFPGSGANTSIVLDVSKTVGQVAFTGNSYTLGTAVGATEPTLTLDNTGASPAAAATITATAGSHTINAKVLTATAGTDLEVTTSTAGALNLAGGLTNVATKTVTLSQTVGGPLTANALTVSSIANDGTLLVKQSGSDAPGYEAIRVTAGIDGTGDTTVGTTGGATTATLITEHIRQDVLTINAGSKVKISATGGAASTSVVNVLNIANASGSFSWSVPGGDISPAATGGPVASGAAVPEPATWLLAVIAALAGLVAWRRRK